MRQTASSNLTPCTELRDVSHGCDGHGSTAGQDILVSLAGIDQQIFQLPIQLNSMAMICRICHEKQHRHVVLVMLHAEVLMGGCGSCDLAVGCCNRQVTQSVLCKQPD